jgi:hypothetical protein
LGSSCAFSISWSIALLALVGVAGLKQVLQITPLQGFLIGFIHTDIEHIFQQPFREINKGGSDGNNNW